MKDNMVERKHKWERIGFKEDYEYQITVFYICEKCKRFEKRRYMYREVK